jgi:hypothetical protein
MTTPSVGPENQNEILVQPEAQELPNPAENKEHPQNQATDPSRHSRKCSICSHPDRDAMEQDFRDWLRPSRIARRYKVHDKALYRHLHAVGLASARRENLAIVLDRIIERGAETPVSGDTIIRAVRAQCCVTDDGRWVEPARKIIYIHEQALPKDQNDPPAAT